MKKQLFDPVKFGKPLPAIKLPASARNFDRIKPVIPDIDPAVAIKAFKRTPAAKGLVGDLSDILDPTPGATPVAVFSACGKSGSAIYLDIWDCDHFDGFTDMGNNLSQCRVWFSGDGYTSWGSGQTKTGVINCYFRAPQTRNYRCDATLQSSGGSASVECSMDNSPFGTLSVNGTITQPHFRTLAAGVHAFRIKQRTGSFFFLSLMVYAV